MSFRAWFKQWRRSLYRLFMIGTKHHKSDRQRKKEHERYVRSKYSRKGRYRVIEKKKRRRHGGNYKTLSALMGFMASSLSIIFLPFGLLHWGYKSAKKKNGARKTGQSPVSHSVPKPQQSRPEKKEKTEDGASTISMPKLNYQSPLTEDKTEPSLSISFTTYETTKPKAVSSESIQANTEPDESTPKSTPKNETDQYIRKRMIIAGSSYCDKEALSRLEIGTYLEVVAEPENPYDKDAVKLLHNGEKVGYISKKDKLPFITCIKLGCKVYGVITNVIDDDFPTKYEFETWYESR